MSSTESAAVARLANGIIPADERDAGAASVRAGEIIAERLAASEPSALYRQGLQVAEKVLEMNPADVRALYLGANALVALGEREKALEWACLALSMDPEESMVLYNVACIYAQLGEIEDSLDCLERAVDAGLTLKGWIVHDSDLEPVRGHQRYLALVEKLDKLSK